MLESHSLALVQCSNDVHLRAIAPYRALRATFDDKADGPHLNAYGTRSGVTMLATWLQPGTWPSGRASEVVDSARLSTSSATAAQRAEAAKTFFDSVATYVGQRYLTDGDGVGALGERRARIQTVRDLYDAPMFAEISEVAHQALTTLSDSVDLALAELGQGGGAPDVFRPVF